MRRALVGCALAVCVPALLAGASHGAEAPAGWAQPNGSLAATRSVTATAIDADTVGGLRVRWRFHVPGDPTDFGSLTATPAVVGGTVYLQDSKSSVYALNLDTGHVRWARIYTAPNDGPNGVSVAGSRVFAATDTTAFALDARTGKRVWSRRLADSDEQFVNIAPVVANGRVYLSTVGFPPGGRGAIYALDARTGARLWKFDTIKEPWPHPQAGGGGAWNPLTVDANGNVYAGIANPGPWGGSKAFPNGGWFRGSTLYTDSLVLLDGRTGKVLWYDQVTAHDIRDYDFHLSPILATQRGAHVVFGSGKAGRVIAWNRSSRQRLWERTLGTRLNDSGPLPAKPVRVCPGLFGGVLTPMAYAAETVYVPVVELCMQESGVRPLSVLQRPPEGGKGTLYALDATSGKSRWSHRFASPLFGCATVARDVVFAPTFDGRIFALSARDGRVLWSARARAGINACPSVAGDLLLVPAGAPHGDFAPRVSELVAYGLPS